MRIRAEFLCPITYDLLTDPVIAADGNTYERAAIEKWLSKTQTSPLNGEALEVRELCVGGVFHAVHASYPPYARRLCAAYVICVLCATVSVH